MRKLLPSFVATEHKEWVQNVIDREISWEKVVQQFKETTRELESGDSTTKLVLALIK